MQFQIGKVKVSNERTTIIAEAGVNHLGRSDYAIRLVDAAVEAGADIIKFQTYSAEKLTTKNAPRFWNWAGEPTIDGSQYDSYKNLDKFSIDQYKELAAYCSNRGIEFMSTPFDLNAVDLLISLGVTAFKIASCDITNKPLLNYVAKTALPILLSTGACELDEIKRAVEELLNSGSGPVLIMHCTLCYPTAAKDANLSALLHLNHVFPNHLLGFSDHTLEIETPSYAVLYGARVIEKHFTFDKTLPLSADHWLSVDEAGMKELIRKVRFAEQLIGIKEKKVLECEELARNNARRSIVAGKNLPEGHVLSMQDLEFKRPGNGLNPFEISKILGRKLKSQVSEDEIITEAKLF